MIIPYTHEQKYIATYLNLLNYLYPQDDRLTKHAQTISHYLSKEHPFHSYGSIRNFLAYDKKVLGHCTAIIDSRNSSVGLTGFYDCVEDTQVSKDLLQAAIAWLKSRGCQRIRGPVNLTIWHMYRFITKQQRAPELFDPVSKLYYPHQWEQAGFERKELYVSAVRTEFAHVLDHTKESYENVTKNGHTIRTFDINNPKEEFEIIRNLANTIFSQSWNFIALSQKEFEDIYRELLPYVHSTFIEIIESSAKIPVGFCFSIPNPNNKKQLIMKTIGVLEAYQRQNLGAALLYSQHEKAKKMGYTELYYPLIRMGNNVTKLPYKGYTIITEYGTYELKFPPHT